MARIPKPSIVEIGANDLHTIRRLDSDTLTKKWSTVENSLEQKRVVAQKVTKQTISFSLCSKYINDYIA